MDALIEAALAARAERACAVFEFHVGAALEDSDGRIHTGCNVENATYGLTICAERVAVSKPSPRARASSAASRSPPIPTR